MPDPAITRWSAVFGEDAGARWLPDGSILLWIWKTQETIALFRVRGPGRVESLGTVARPIFGLRVSDDLRRATVVVRTYHGDAWMSQVLRP